VFEGDGSMRFRALVASNEVRGHQRSSHCSAIRESWLNMVFWTATVANRRRVGKAAAHAEQL
jgi:hypothetical protein